MKMYNNDLGRRMLIDIMTVIDGADHPETRSIRNPGFNLIHMKDLRGFPTSIQISFFVQYSWRSLVLEGSVNLFIGFCYA